MPRSLPLSRRLSTALRWPAGVGLTSWRYLWRTTPIRRSEEPGALPDDGPPPLPDDVERDELQQPQDGAGPLFHRRYRVHIRESDLSAEELMARVMADVNAAAPTELASFHRLRGDEGPLRAGDEWVVRMPGPWDGPVRVIETTPTSFRLATLERHLEAGQIDFRAAREGRLAFTIESWARSGDRLSNLLYDRLRMSKEVQLHMWASVLERVVTLSGGRRDGPLEISTRRVEGERGRQLLRDRHARAALDALHEAPLNFDLARSDDARWHVDDYREPLPREAPGPPEEGGSWRIAQRLMRGYEFADPRIVRAVYHADAPLERRDMLLEIRFLGLRFHAGVRVGGVVDETRTVDGREVRVWGWSYRTLKGHFEMGQMDYEVWKRLDDGEVEFRIHVFSRAAPIANPVKRVGFRIVGRSQQRRFARHAGERLARLVRAELEQGRGAPAGLPPLADAVAVGPASDRADLDDRLARQVGGDAA